MNPDDDDPTIICKILKDFRENSNNYYRSSILPLNISKDRNAGFVSSQTRRLKFDDAKTNNTSEIPDKKMKLTTPNQRELAEEVMSPWEIRRLKSETYKSRTQLIEAEERISKLERMKLETEMHYAGEKKRLEEALNEEREKVSLLEKRIKFIREREADTVKQFKQLQCSENSKDGSHGEALFELQKENLMLKEQIYEFQNDVENMKKNENIEITKLMSELEILKSKDESNVQLIEDLRSELTEKSNELRKLEIEQTKLLTATKRVKDLENERETYLEARAYVESQNKKLLQLPKLEKDLAELKEENKRLYSSITNMMNLEEMVETYKAREKTMSKLEEEHIKLLSETKAQRIELNNVHNLAKHFCKEDNENLKPVTLIERRLEELVRKELWYVSENKNWEIKANNLKEKLVEKEAEILKFKKEMERLHSSCETQAVTIKRLRKQLGIVSMERNDLRSLLDSWQKDLTINSEGYNQFDILQKVIEGYKERTAQLEIDPLITAGVGSDNTAILEREKLQKQEVSLREENKKLLEKIQYLNDQLEYRHLKGDFDPRQTKIIHLKSNPASEAIQNYEDKFNKATEEICKLRERIKIMEEGNSQDVTRIVEERVQTNSIKEIQDLKDRVKQLEIQNQRLVEVFKKRTHDFRDAMYMLFGYKIDLLGNGQYRLCSQYAFDPQDVLLFQTSQDGHGSMELLETSYSQTLSEFIDIHLKQHKSIPLFLSSLTIDLFNKQTFTSFSTTIPTLTCDV